MPAALLDGLLEQSASSAGAAYDGRAPALYFPRHQIVACEIGFMRNARSGDFATNRQE